MSNLTRTEMQDELIGIFKKNVFRLGADKLLNYIENETDFFSAPASTRYHLARVGGLLEHSLNVYKQLLLEDDSQDVEQLETLTICGLLHDICKTNFYNIEYRNSKNEKGYWEKVPYFAVKDNFPYGHGEKSVYLIERFIKLKEEEAMAIRWHMGGFDNIENKASISLAFDLYPLALKLHIADLKASYLLEKREE